jgi:ribosome-associated toxin RatA of RatAB toxin-antitoxin module
MDVHFAETRRAAAPARILFEVVTDYAGYPGFHSALMHVAVLRKDEHGAEFVADRRTKIGERVRAVDRYERDGALVVERTFAGDAVARSTWTIRPSDDERYCTLSIDAVQSASRLRGTVMRPFLRHHFYGSNVTPFIAEAERRARDVRVTR